MSESSGPLGRIVRLQIQQSSLTVGERPDRRYDPSPLLSVNELTLTPLGALARLPDGERVMDLHHVQHPQTHNIDNVNPLSVNFTAHYDAMRAEFGGHLWNGCAGENILVETLQRLHLDDLAQGLLIQTESGQAVALRQVVVAHPCRPFSGYVLGGTEGMVKEALQFLDNGMRGFYCVLAQEAPVTMAVGDSVFLSAQ